MSRVVGGTWGHLSANVGTSKHVGGNKVSTISLLGCGTSVALTTGPTDEEQEEDGCMYRYGIICLHDDITIKGVYRLSYYKIFELSIQRYKRGTQQLNLLIKR